MYYCALSLGVLQHILPRFLVTCAIWSTVSVNFLLRKYYNYLNNIDMVLLRTSYNICTGASSNTILDYNLVRFGVCMIKLHHERMLILRCILPHKKLNYLQKKSYLPKNSITITETISNTRTKSQPLPEKSKPLVKNS